MLDSISLIITVYNRHQYLATAIESILAQTRSNFDLLIWDDGSTDRSIEIAQYYVQKDARVRVVTAPHCGVASAIKAAVAETSGNYVGWVDSDDWLAPTALEETGRVLDACPAVGLVYTNYEAVDEQGQNNRIGERCQIPYSKDQLLVDFMTFHFRLIRRSVYEQVGGIDLSFELAEDYDLCLRLSEVTEIYHLAQSLYFYRRHDGNLTNNQLEQIRWAYRASVQALKRRGLDQKYAIDLNVVSQFALRRLR